MLPRLEPRVPFVSVPVLTTKTIRYPRGVSPNVSPRPTAGPFTAAPSKLTVSTAVQQQRVPSNLDTSRYSPSTLAHARNSLPPASPLSATLHSVQPAPRNHHHHHHTKGRRSETMAPRTNGPANIQILPPPTGAAAHGAPAAPPTPSKQQGMGKISSFFGWKGNNNAKDAAATSPVVASSPTTISDRSSPAASPNGTSLSSFPSALQPKPAPPLPAPIDVPRANGPAANRPPSPLPPTAETEAMEDLEEELRDLGAELAASIRREMELEDQVERLQADNPGALDRERRTSDYYSDSGASQTRGEPDAAGAKGEDAETLKRRWEQERGALKAESTQRALDERARRRRLEEQVRSLESHVHEVRPLSLPISTPPLTRPRRSSTGK